MNSRSHNMVLALFALDVLLLTIAFIANQYLKYGADTPEPLYPVYFVMLVNWVLIHLLSMSDYGFLFLRRNIRKVFFQQISRYVTFIGFVSASLLAFHMGNYSRFFIFGSIGTFFVLKTLMLFLSYFWLGAKRREGRHMIKVLVVGAGKLGKRYFNHMNAHPKLGYDVVGFLDDNPETKIDAVKPYILGSLSEISKVLEDNGIDKVVISLAQRHTEAVKQIVSAADFHGKRIHMVLDFYPLHKRRVKFSTLEGIPMVNVDEVPLDKFGNFIVKRSVDLVLSFVALLFLSPLFLIISVLIKCDSKGPVLYKPVRVSKGGKHFSMLKFRSMYADLDDKGSTVKDDKRITRLGRILRKTNLDELPQLWNVFVNDMSLIGPRPHRVALNAELQNSVERYMIRSYVKPGLSGWAQVNGWRGPTVTEEQRVGRTQFDLWYVENWSFWLDLKIVWLTFFGPRTYKNAF